MGYVRPSKPIVDKPTAFKTLRNQPDRSVKMARKRKGLRFGTLNVGSLNKMGRKEEIIKMMIRRKIDILGFSETKWPGQGMKQMRRGHHIVWSGEKEEKRNGVAIILSPEMIDKVTQTTFQEE
jgi:exonuclease III